MKPSFLTVLIATVVTLSHVTAETRSLRGSRELTGTKESKKCIGNKCMDKVEPTDFEPKDVNDQDKPTVITVIHRFDNFTAPNTTLESQYLIKEQPIQEEETPSDATFIVGTWPPDPVIKQVNSTLPTFPSVERIEEKLDKKKKDAPTNDVHSTPGPLQGESETSNNAETSTAVDTTSPPDPHVEQSKEETEPDNATVGPVVDPHVEQQKPESKKPDIKETTDDKDPPQDKSVPPPRDESGNCGKAEKKDTGKDKEDPMSMDPQDSSNPEKRLELPPCNESYSDYLLCTVIHIGNCIPCDRACPGLIPQENCESFADWYDRNDKCCKNDECGQQLENFKKCHDCPQDKSPEIIQQGTPEPELETSQVEKPTNEGLEKDLTTESPHAEQEVPKLVQDNATFPISSLPCCCACRMLPCDCQCETLEDSFVYKAISDAQQRVSLQQ